jgi:hypothetical protein
MSCRDQCGNERTTHGAGGACNKDAHVGTLIWLQIISAINPHRNEFKRTSRPPEARESRAPRDPHGAMFANSASSEMLAAIPRATIAVIIARMMRSGFNSMCAVADR